mmetsp:Transcript_1187/g.2580  ORF Transcript_1187/g.2580 Transcript_1187/m.2580 type:complete len:306 (-) Transcript_1187:160-1077(-)|eukprot:CAMPEP_0116134934 /NCGR_PEP_ID=MMETSP0329-20121206/10924_1 /TAXON_ID=697910 /ORGANISM="Pseudo-nitzschia arenysensis, Strain B593" /LENGTH=305 /DNA_ID=CAMNT_0003629705 /DNA_START=304 /DNA_END=1221 /DNA_ORIENTATION=+
MKQDTSTPPFLSLRGTEGEKASPVEWSSDFYFNEKEHRFCKSHISPSPPTTGARRVSTASSGTNASSNELSFIPSSVSLSSSSSSIGTKSNDDTDDSFESSSISDEDDPIISLEALSLDTRRISLGQRPGKQMYKSKPTFRAMNLPRKNSRKQLEPPIESLNLASSFERNDGFSLSRRRSSENTNLIPFGQSSDETTPLPNFSNGSLVTQQRRRTSAKKYTIKKTTSSVQKKTPISEIQDPKVPRTKRQRGGSDFTMASASDGSTDSRTASKSSPRKRRRVNRNRAMGAGDFDSILSQINTTDSL